MLLSDVQRETLVDAASNCPQHWQCSIYFNNVAELRDTAEESLRLLCRAIYDERVPALFGLDLYGSIVGMFELNNLGRAYTAFCFHIICCIVGGRACCKQIAGMLLCLVITVIDYSLQHIC